MKSAPDILGELTAALSPAGIRLRGVAQFGEGEGPETGDGSRARSIVLLGNIGGSIWPAFSRWRDGEHDRGGTDPLDRWSKVVIAPVAARFGARAWFPSDPPYMPFQAWAKRAEGLEASPLGILIHPEYGLWHGYRGALGFAGRIAIATPERRMSPCGECETKPCLGACPVGAVHEAGPDYAACLDHLSTEAGTQGCMATGCLARSACPVGKAYEYGQAQLAFHQLAFLNAASGQ